MATTTGRSTSTRARSTGGSAGLPLTKAQFNKFERWLSTGQQLLPMMQSAFGGESGETGGTGIRGGTRAQHAKAGRAGGAARAKTNRSSGANAQQ